MNDAIMTVKKSECLALVASNNNNNSKRKVAKAIKNQCLDE